MSENEIQKENTQKKKIVCTGTWKHSLKRLKEWLTDE